MSSDADATVTEVSSSSSDPDLSPSSDDDGDHDVDLTYPSPEDSSSSSDADLSSSSEDDSTPSLAVKDLSSSRDADLSSSSEEPEEQVISPVKALSSAGDLSSSSEDPEEHGISTRSLPPRIQPRRQSTRTSSKGDTKACINNPNLTFLENVSTPQYRAYSRDGKTGTLPGVKKKFCETFPVIFRDRARDGWIEAWEEGRQVWHKKGKKKSGESVRYFGSARCTYKKGKQEILLKVGTESKGLFWAPAAQFAEDTTRNKEEVTPEWVETAKQNLDVADGLLAKQILDYLEKPPNGQKVSSNTKAAVSSKPVKPPRAGKTPQTVSKYFCDGCTDQITGLYMPSVLS